MASDFKLVFQFVEKHALEKPDSLAAVTDSGKYSYAQLDKASNQLAMLLLEKGLDKGDRVGILMENSLEYLASYLGVQKAGGVAVPLNTDLKPDKYIALIEDITPRAILSHTKLERKLKAIPWGDIKPEYLVVHNMKLNWGEYPISGLFNWQLDCDYSEKVNLENPLGESDLANIIFTSGSTGVPKGVMLTHKNIVSNTLSICEYLKLTPEDKQMVVLPFFYVMGQSLMNSAFCSGGSIVINNKFAYPATVVQQMIDEKVTGFAGVPSTYAYLLNRSPFEASCKDMPTLRFCAQAGGHMSGKIKKQLLEILPNPHSLWIMYGATEASARLAYVPAEKLMDKLDSIGIPIPGVQLSVLGPKGEELAENETGEIVARGPNIMQGYWGDSKTTAQVLDDKGYHTGDMGFKDSDGFFFVTGRKDSLLKVGGHRVNPIEIEDNIAETDMAMESCVMGIEDALLGNKLVALVTPVSEELSPKDLAAALGKKLPSFKMPGEIRFTKNLPKNANGKLDRKACLELFLGS